MKVSPLHGQTTKDPVEPLALRPINALRIVLWLVLAWLLGNVLPIPVVVVIGTVLVAIETGLVLRRLWPSEDTSVQRVVIRASSPIVHEERHDDEEHLDSKSPEEDIEEHDENPGTIVFVEESEDVEVDTGVYNERAHWLGLLSQLGMPVVLFVGAMGFWTITTAASQQQEVTKVLVTAGIILALLAGSLLKRKAWKQLKYTTIAIVVIAVAVAGTSRSDIATLITIGLILAAVFYALNPLIRWYYTRYILEKNSFMIDFNPPPWLPMSDSRPSILMNRIDSVKASQSWLMRVLRVNCGTLLLDTPGQEDEAFHDMRWLRNFRQLEESILERIGDKPED